MTDLNKKIEKIIVESIEWGGAGTVTIHKGESADQILSTVYKHLVKKLVGREIAKVYKYDNTLTKDEWDARISWWNNAISEIKQLLKKELLK